MKTLLRCRTQRRLKLARCYILGWMPWQQQSDRASLTQGIHSSTVTRVSRHLCPLASPLASPLALTPAPVQRALTRWEAQDDDRCEKAEHLLAIADAYSPY
jgi:hypothetical protein